MINELSNSELLWVSGGGKKFRRKWKNFAKKAERFLEGFVRWTSLLLAAKHSAEAVAAEFTKDKDNH